jgi:MFS family permease
MDSAHQNLIEFQKEKIEHKEKSQRSLIYLLIFLFTLHFTPATYVESTFLENLVGSKNVGFIFSIASVITIIGIAIVRKIIRAVGNYKTFLSALIIEFVALFVLSISLFVESNIFWNSIFIVFFIIGFIARSIAFFNFDIFTEHLSKDSETGGVRGTFLTSLNFAFVIGPLLSGMIINNDSDIGKVFALGCLILLPVIHITIKYFKNFEDNKYQEYNFGETFWYVLKKDDLRRIFICNFLLFFFYSWMIIYTPIYLHEKIGFGLGQVATLIGIGLIPFLLLQFYLGKLADTKYGEKEILTTGLIITGLSTILITFIPFKIFILWAIILFITRIGASMVETMVEIYLFKKVNAKNLDIISMYRAVRPVAYIVAPLLASFILIFLDIKYLFIFLGIIMLTGVLASLKIKDTL